MAIITDDRKVVWEGNAGVSGGIPSSAGKTIFTTLTSSATAQDIRDAITGAPTNQVVALGSGTFSLSASVDWQGVNPGVVLRGAGPGVTILTWSTFSLTSMYMRGNFSESALSVDANLSIDATKGSSTLTLASVPSWVTVGDLIGVDQLDDSSFVTDVGQEAGSSYRELAGNGHRGLCTLARVTAKTATTITVELPLPYGYKASQTAQIWQPAYDPSTSNPLTGCGIENLTIKASFTSSQSKAIFIENADSCYVKNVNIDTPADLGIYMQFAYRCEVRHCKLSGFSLLDAGQGYAVALYNVCTGCLIEDNIILDAHLGMSVNYGGSYNVFAYNYEGDGQSISKQNPGMGTHGTHAYTTLFEGNFCEDKFLGDNTHGSASHNTLFRNRITGDNVNVTQDDSRTCVTIEWYNRYCSAVGNVVGLPTFQDKYLADSTSQSSGSVGVEFKIGPWSGIQNQYTTENDDNSYTTGSFVLITANYDYVSNSIHYDSNVADHTPVTSYIYSSKPAYWGVLTFPAYDPSSLRASKTADIVAIPAGYRYINGNDPPLTAGGSARGGVAKIGGSSKSN